VPGAAERHRGITDHAGRATCDIDGLELAMSEEANTPAVGTPERQPGAVRAIELL